MADAFRHFERAAASFVDCDRIDWRALRARVRLRGERELLENLRVIAALRERYWSAGRAPAHPPVAPAIVAAGGAALTAVYLSLAVGEWIQSGADRVRIGQLVLAIAFAAPGLWLRFAPARDARRLSLVAVFLCASTCFARSAAGQPADAFGGRLAGVYIEAFLPACAWRFALDFPEVLRFAPFDRVARRAAAFAWTLGAALFGLNVAAGRTLVEPGRARLLLHDDPRHWFWHALSLTLAPALAAILIRARRAPDAERRRVMRLASAVALGLSPFVALAVARMLAPGVDAWFRLGAAPGRSILYGIVAAGLAATPMLSAAAVLVDRPFELPAAADASAATRRRRSQLPFAVKRRHAALARGRASIAAAIDRIATSRTGREKARGLGEELRSAVGATDVHVLVASDRGAYVDEARPSQRLAASAALAAVLREASDPVDVHPASALSRLLPADERRWIADNEAALAAGVHRPDGRLVAIVVLCRRVAAEEYDSRDREIVAALTVVAGSTWPDPIDSRVHRNDDEAALECPRCGLVAAPHERRCACAVDEVLAALPATLAAKFVVERRLGAGGCGTVYLARDGRLDRPVALKTLGRMRPREFARLVDEARAMAALDHECLATLYGLEVWRDTPVLVVEYLANGTLAERLAARRLSREEAAAVGVRLARALVYMHDRGVLHCDLKPSNVGFTKAGDAKVLDFGLATLTRRVDADAVDDDDIEDSPRRRGGTPAYLPPDATRRAADAGDDLWAVAVVLLESLTGVNPYAGAPRWTQFRALDPLACVRDVDVPPAFAAFFRRALAPVRAERFQTAGALLEAWELANRSSRPR